MECNSETFLWESSLNFKNALLIVPYIHSLISTACYNQLFADANIKPSNLPSMEEALDIVKLGGVGRTLC